MTHAVGKANLRTPRGTGTEESDEEEEVMDMDE
jgi:hypothetical protein